ncbi:MXAN_5187 C-terminal domain-containing protein [Sorangium sp. So ce1389]|uniref:MXAN_5187 C-terminal domain-containing protein n=1 Tax=Sorangium sp. So ce1389 TaxID=3133336 RepID=UPI003F5F2210
MESSEVERELEELETRIERLRALYEQYFMGIERLEPMIPRKDVERRIWVMRREQIRNTGLRFKFQMLLQRYNTFQQYWGRISREIENGTYRRDVLRAAKRVGAKEALTIVGRKRAERYAELAEQQATARETARRGDDGDDHEEIDVDDEAVTLAPPPLPAAPPARGRALAVEEEDPSRDDVAHVAPPIAPEPSSVAPASPQVRPLVALVPPAPPQAAAAVKPAPLGGLPRGLGLTRPQQKPAEIRPAEAKPAEASPAGARPSARPAADRNQPAAAGATSRQRLAELTAEMRAQRAQSAQAGDATKAAPGPPGVVADAAPEPAPSPPRRPPPPLPARSQPGRPAAAPAAAAASPPAAAAAPAAAAPAAAEAKGAAAAARRQERVHSDRPPPTRRRRSTAPPAADTGAASGARHAGPRASSRPPEAARPGLDAGARARPGPPPQQRSAARDDELPEQRLRQIYAKYVETKRAARESTAGVTYERLAESLRAQAAKLRATNPAKSVDYDVVIKDGKTLLKPILK